MSIVTLYFCKSLILKECYMLQSYVTYEQVCESLLGSEGASVIKVQIRFGAIYIYIYITI